MYVYIHVNALFLGEKKNKGNDILLVMVAFGLMIRFYVHLLNQY